MFPLKTGALPLLEALHAAGIPCAVASSSSVDEIRHRLGHVDVLKYFRSIAGGDEVTHGKPDPALYLLAAARLGVAPEDCIAFEDSENGARAAQAAGVRVVIVPDLKHPPEDVAARAPRRHRLAGRGASPTCRTGSRSCERAATRTTPCASWAAIRRPRWPRCAS